MRTETFDAPAKRPDGTTVASRYTRVFCDCCPGKLEYEGPASFAVAAVKKAGGTISHTGVVRCKDRSEQQNASLHNAVWRV